MAVGWFLGLAIVFWLELRDKLIRTERDFEFYLELPTLALVPFVDKSAGPRRKSLPAGTATGARAGVRETLDI